MPEIVTCSACDKETYETLSSCPHCNSDLIPKIVPEERIAKNFDVSISHELFKEKLKQGKIEIILDYESMKENGYILVVPGSYKKFLKNLSILATISILIVGVLLFNFGGRLDLNSGFEGYIEGKIIGFILIFILAIPWFWIQRIRYKLQVKNLIEDETYYIKMLSEGFLTIKMK